MSETEKRQRAEYQKMRTRRIYIRSIILVVLAAAVLLCGMSASRLSQNAYVTYTESGSAEYQVYLKDNQFYSQEYLTKDYAYIAKLVDTVDAQFDYTMKAAGKAEYEYSYYLDAQLKIVDRDSDAALFDPVYSLVEKQSGISEDASLKLSQQIAVDFHKFNDIAKEFVSAFELDKPKCTLVVTMHVNIDGTCPNVTDGQGNYAVSVNIPLNQPTLKIETEASVPQAAKTLACNTTGVKLLTIAGGVLAVAALVWAVMLAIYIIRTRDRHINYARQVKKILSSYKSYIQRIKDPLVTEGYQVLHVETFTELLELRDTLQMPILMYEDEDRTCAKFMIPTGAGFIYAYEVVVAGIYAQV